MLLVMTKDNFVYRRTFCQCLLLWPDDTLLSCDSTSLGR